MRTWSEGSSCRRKAGSTDLGYQLTGKILQPGLRQESRRGDGSLQKDPARLDSPVVCYKTLMVPDLWQATNYQETETNAMMAWCDGVGSVQGMCPASSTQPSVELCGTMTGNFYLQSVYNGGQSSYLKPWKGVKKWGRQWLW